MKKIVVCLIVMFAVTELSSQYVVKEAQELESLKKLPQEKVFVHHTGPVVLSGEYLYYSFYCFNTQNNKASDISAVGYIALINEEKEFILEQKLKLERGLAQGDFFVNTDIPSGNYKLLGYTQWMKNNGISQVFQDDLIIVNPYQVDQTKILPNGSEVAKGDVSQAIKMDSSTVSIQLEKEKFGKREKVKLKVRNYKGPLGNGNYTIKVQKKEDIPISGPNTSISFANDYFNVSKELKREVGDSIYLPEQRGELLYGTVTDASNQKPVSDKTVVISVPGDEFLLKFARTDSDGNFYSYIKKDYKLSNAVLQIDDENIAYSIALRELPKLNISGLNFGQFHLKKEYSSFIQERSINNQLENQFFSTKPDSVLLGDPIDPFDGGVPEVVYLDEYTRFKTFEETLVEILNKAGYRNNGDERDYIRILQDFEKATEDYNDYPAIVLIDGVYIPNHENIKNFDARLIESISLTRDQFRLADKDYQGIMAVKTFNGDYYKSYQTDYGINTQITKPIQKKNYFKQRYSETLDTVYGRVPDYRRLLFWEPHVEVESNQYDFEFFTSDVSGEYEVVLDGFTSYGKPLYFSKTLVVE